MTNNKSARARRQEQIARQQQRARLIRIGGVLAVVAVVAIIAIISVFSRQGAKENSPMQTERPLAGIAPAQRNNYYNAYPETVVDADKSYTAILRTEAGDIHVRLFAGEAPQTVNNFVYLANQGFYDNTTFHRVIDNFMAQAGDPSGTGRGGPGYQFADEFQSGLRFDRPGLLAMANAGPATNGSQFFITFVPTPHLDNRHTIFGEVVDGEEVLSQITRRDPGASRPGTVIERIDILEE
jgi:cyclophilin family peptidyl-prolyl cis-trans isomerase